MGSAQDVVLAARAASGENDARRELVRRVLPRVRAAASYLSARGPDVDDLTQRALIEVLRAAGSFRGESSLETWADRITSRVVLRLIRKRRLISAREEAVDATPEFPDWAGESSNLADQVALRRSIASALSKLPEERRVALVLKHVYGYSVEEVAESVGAPVNTVRDRLRVARAQLREWLGGAEAEDADET